MRKSSHLMGLQVISLEDGTKVGRIKGLIVDPAAKSLTAMVVEGSRLWREQKFIPFAKVHSMGANAITVSREQNVQKAASLPEIVKLWKDRTPLIGARVVTEGGDMLGQVMDYGIDHATGGITGLELSRSSLAATLKGRSWLPASSLLTLGKEIIVATNQARDELTTIDGGLEQRARRLKGNIKERSLTWRRKYSADKAQEDRDDFNF